MATNRAVAARWFGTGWLAVLALWASAGDRPAATASGQRVEWGIISDVHHGVIHWAYPGTGYVELDFVRAFLADMREHPVEFIIQLGDFCKPSDGQPMLDLWNTFDGPRLVSSALSLTFSAGARSHSKMLNCR